MDRRFIVAFVVSLLILLGYPYYLRMVGINQKPGIIYEKKEVESLARTTEAPKPKLVGDKALPFKNNLFSLLFTTRGGNILLLTQGDTTLYKAGVQEEGIFGLKLLYENENLANEIFQAENATHFVYEKPSQFRLQKNYFVGEDVPTLVLELQMENLSDREKNFSFALDYALDMNFGAAPDQGMAKMVRLSTDELHITPYASLKKKPSVTSEDIDWHGLVRKHYTLLVKPDWKIVGQDTQIQSERLASELKFTPITVPAGGKATARILVYAGPLHYGTLKSFGLGFERIFSHGALGILRVALLSGLNFFYQLTKNYGVAILLITLLIKLLFTPLTHLSYQSMGKMQALQPKIKALQKQHQKDSARMNKEMMELYKRNRVNPMMGCLPLVLQIPIFISFYQVLSQAVELKGADFIFWIHDLSEPDRLFLFPTTLPFVGHSFNLLPILMLGSMLWQQKLTPQTATAPGQEKLMYLMPVIFGFVFYNLPSGLVLYWIVNNLLTIFHQLVIKRIPVIIHHEDR